MSNTPKTDANCGWPVSHHGRIDISDLRWSPDGPFVHSSVARDLEKENAELKADIRAHEQINKQLIEDKRRLDFLATLTGSGWACLHLNHKGTNDDWLLTRKQIDRRMATEAQP